MTEPVLMDVYVKDRLVGTLGDATGGAYVFSYLPGVPNDHFVSLTMPVRLESYVWQRGLPPFFLMNLPEGYQKDLLRIQLGPHADITDIGLLALTGHRTIGRVRIFPHGQSPEAEYSDLNMAELLASPDSRNHLLRYLEKGVAEGVSGVMPKALRLQSRATAIANEYILKTSPADLPGLAINEYLCLEVARRAQLDVPEATLSKDGDVLAVRRFDRRDDGSAIGVEDFCALKGLDPANKYRGTLEDLAKLLAAYVPNQQLSKNAKQLFKLLLINCALRNADAHLKNFALTYTTLTDVALAPVYDVVTVSAYPQYEDQPPALTLAGRKVWEIGKLLHLYGATRLSLPKNEMAVCLDDVSNAIEKLIPEVTKYVNAYPTFRETAKRMLNEWEKGLLDIQPNVKARPRMVNELRISAGLSDATTVRKKSNVYKNPDGGFSHKVR